MNDYDLGNFRVTLREAILAVTFLSGMTAEFAYNQMTLSNRKDRVAVMEDRALSTSIYQKRNEGIIDQHSDAIMSLQESSGQMVWHFSKASEHPR